jgi:DNA-binding MarR family transcriptional regulator
MAGPGPMLGGMSEAPVTKRALAGRVWRVMFDFLTRTAPLRTKSLGRRGLTPNDSRALFGLDLHEGRTMRSLADSWKCDPSNATWIVDRLEKLGLAERRTIPHDRRVKLVVLTAKGLQTRRGLLKEFHRPPAELTALDRDDLENLHRVLVKLAPPPAVSLPPGRTRASAG